MCISSSNQSDLPGVLNLLTLLVDPAFSKACRFLAQPVESTSSDSNHPLCPPEMTPIHITPSTEPFLEKTIPYREFVRGL
ncbi:hypothetical protein DSO57_1019439 [Entomophthora muscae]|uniref:Uncharacterized protein n=1 Tax=Entomophthora muscae TaxID=34485 RepID=A0ACC2S665_9FUNG|nr:hypothetical protein DSO57_1019439 [Entomophthora muscae]